MIEKLKKYTFGASSVILLAFSLPLDAQEISSLKAVNTPYDEQHPVISPNGELFFSVGFHPDNLGGQTDAGDIWMSKKDMEGRYNSPVHVKSLSTRGNDVIVGFPDALTALVYHSGDGVNFKQGIHQYARFGNEWNHVRILEMGNFRNQGTHFSGRLSHNKQVIIMAMSSFGSYGNEDLYISEQIREGVWSSPVNLGPDINTFSQELTPSISADLSRIYYSSDSNVPGRGRDVFTATRIDESWEKWSSPQPLEQINSEGAELSFVIFDVDNSLAFYTSTQNSEGFGDILLITHQSEERETVVEVLQEVKDQKDTSSARGEIEETMIKGDSLHQETIVQIADASAVLIEDKEKLQIDTIENDDFILSLKVIDQSTKEGIPYTLFYTDLRGVKRQVQDLEELEEPLRSQKIKALTINSEGYIPTYLSLDNDFENKQLVSMARIESGASIILENIQFNRGTSDFADVKSIAQLDELVEFLRGNSNVRVRLEGHTDNAGDPQLNKELSMQRASKIRAYLTLKGIDFERVRIAGWGGSRPLADNATEEGKAKNRRVEMIIDSVNR